jgi:hypothetical protein
LDVSGDFSFGRPQKDTDRGQLRSFQSGASRGELSWPRRFHRLVRFVRLVMMNGRSFRISIWRRKILNASPGFIPKRARTFSARRKRAVINLITKGVSGIMKISAEVFGAYLNCPTKCWLRAAGHPPTGNAYSEWVKAQNDSYRGPHAKVGHDEVLPGRRLQLLVRPPNRADHFITSGAELDRQARQRNTVEHRAPGFAGTNRQRRCQRSRRDQLTSLYSRRLRLLR